MPYRDKSKQQAANREAKRRQRADVIPCMVGDVIPTDVIPAKLEGDVIPAQNVIPCHTLPTEWAHLKAWLADPGQTGMPRVERLQRLAGSLGKLGDEVEFGGLTISEIGKVIGVKGPLYSK